jgi:hypothetical protein
MVLAKEGNLCYHSRNHMNIFRQLCYRLAIAIGATAAATVLWVPGAAAATECTSVYCGDGIKSGLLMLSGLGGIATAVSLTDLIIILITFVLNIVLLLALAAIIVAGIYLIVSNGDEAQKDKAKKIVMYCVAGIALILLARVIIIFVNGLF